MAGPPPTRMQLVLGSRRPEPPNPVRALQERLRDERSKKVAFVSHCLLNENVRYLGGATRPGAVDEVVEALRRDGVGIVQMPCPEQRVWGGVLKRRLLALYGSRLARNEIGRAALAMVAKAWTTHRYNQLARQVAGEVDDYVRSGFEVTEVVGVGASPSCGVLTTLDLDGALAAMGHCDPRTIDREAVNARVVADNVIPGRGLFLASLARQLARRGLAVPMHEHDLLAELDSAGSPR